jgi:RNA polymerase-binding transcription factor DksA
MNTPRERLEQELKTAVARLRHLDGTVTVDERVGSAGSNCPFADEVDAIHASESREIGFATRELLVERVHRLSAAVDRLADGDYGVCTECDEKIAPARLHALPEVQTCVRCQDRLERASRRDARVESELSEA